MDNILNLARYPLHEAGGQGFDAMIRDIRGQLDADGMFNLEGFLTDPARSDQVSRIAPRIGVDTFRHTRRHNIYFNPQIDGLDPGHPALREAETINNTLCADQLKGSVLDALYHWPPFANLLAKAMGKDVLFPMGDPLAGLNVMAYRDGEALNWHFDRSEFTTTLLLQAPHKGGEFEYVRDLRTADDPNYGGVAEVVSGARTPAVMRLDPGTLNVFRGKNTAHRVSPVRGETSRIIAVFSFFDRPDVQFSTQERIGFYGRAT